MKFAPVRPPTQSKAFLPARLASSRYTSVCGKAPFWGWRYAFNNVCKHALFFDIFIYIYYINFVDATVVSYVMLAFVKP